MRDQPDLRSGTLTKFPQRIRSSGRRAQPDAAARGARFDRLTAAIERVFEARVLQHRRRDRNVGLDLRRPSTPGRRPCPSAGSFDIATGGRAGCRDSRRRGRRTLPPLGALILPSMFMRRTSPPEYASTSPLTVRTDPPPSCRPTPLVARADIAAGGIQPHGARGVVEVDAPPPVR